MELRRVYHHEEGVSGELRVALDIAHGLKEFPTWDEVVEVLRRIPDSPNYFTYAVSDEYGWQIHVLVP